MYELNILCKNAKGTFKNPQKVPCSYTKRYDFYIVLKF